ncbi:hypothetical protein GCM10026988_22790 [Vibrio panuliri]
MFQRDDNSQDGELSVSGALVKIVDFESLDDGLLGITVVGMKRFQTTKVRVEPDGLRFAKVDWLPSWDVSSMTEEESYIGLQLQKVYAQFPQIGELYDQCFFDDAAWVSQRWLELLPVNLSQFDYLVRQKDCSEAMRFLSIVIEKE